MSRFLTLAFLSVFSIMSASAFAATPAPATYILQVSSNLGCDSLEIHLIPNKEANNAQVIRFGKGAFAAAQVPAGEYSFGDVTCINDRNSQSFELLKDKISPLRLVSGLAYYGGQIIFEKTEEIDVNSAPDALSTCTRKMSRARMDTNDLCQDGVGVGTAAISSKTVNVYVPDVADQDIAAVRSAFSASKTQLLYLPLKG